MSITIIKPRPAFSIVKPARTVRVQTGGPGLRGLPGAVGAPGVNGAYSMADPAGFPFIGDKVPFSSGGVAKYAMFEDAGMASPWNLYPDGGRFAGPATAGTIYATTFTSNPNILGYNGATGAAGPKFTYNNSTNGGVGAALDPAVDDLVAKMRAPAAAMSNPRRYGTEFYTLEVTAGTGTLASLVVGGTTHYLSLTHLTRPSPPVVTLYYWVRAVTGQIALVTGNDRFVDGARLAASTAYTPAAGWKHVAVHFQEKLSGVGWLGYISSLFGLYATPGTVYQIAAPAMVSGTPPKGQLTAIVPYHGAFG